jgi:hypothetical protein
MDKAHYAGLREIRTAMKKRKTSDHSDVVVVTPVKSDSLATPMMKTPVKSVPDKKRKQATRIESSQDTLVGSDYGSGTQ